MKYTQYSKSAYLRLCRLYNEAEQHIATDIGQTNFIQLSIQLHAAKANVPNRWGLPGFIRSCGNNECELSGSV